MLKNYLKISIRFWKHNKVFLTINAICLSIALAVSFLILLFLINELSFDSFYSKKDRIFRVLNYYKDYKETYTYTPYVLGSSLKETYPQVEATAGIRQIDFKIKVQNDYLKIRYAITTDAKVFDIFETHFIYGSYKEDLLDNHFAIILSREISEKIFPGQNPVGKEIIGSIKNHDYVFIIQGVIENLPENTILKAQCFLSNILEFDQLNNAYQVNNADKNWEFNNWTTWVLLKNKSDAKIIESQIHLFEDKYLGLNSHFHYYLQKLSKVYLGSDNIGGPGIKGDNKAIKLFIIIGFVLIIIASTNYIILSTAIMSDRAKEVALRKTFGASKSNIEIQMLSETILLSFVSFPIALIIMYLMLPLTNVLFQTNIFFIASNFSSYFLGFLILTILIGLFSGLYTSSYLSKLKVHSIFNISFLTGKNRIKISSVLIIFELIIFCICISIIQVIRSQYQYALKRDPGFFYRDVLLIDLGRNFLHYSAFCNAINSIPNVISASGTRECLPMVNSGVALLQNRQNKDLLVEVETMLIDFDFIKTMGIKVLYGRDFSKEYPSDLSNACILNETAVKKLGISNPIGQKLAGRTIIGVVKDFNLHSIQTDIPATFIQLTDEYIFQAEVHYNSGTFNQILPIIKSQWIKYAPVGKIFEYSTIEDLTKTLYSSEKNLKTIVTLFSIIIILIASSGLFGIILFLTRKRAKEICIKKVFGSSSKSIIYSFFHKHLLLVTISNIISIPFVLILMSNWLNKFAFRIKLYPQLFILSFLISSIIVCLTVYGASFKAANMNPAKILKYE